MPRNLDGYAPALAEVICWGLVAILSGLLSRFQIVSWTSGTMEVESSIKYLHWILAASVTVVAALSSVVSSTWITVRFGYILLRKLSNIPLTARSRLCFHRSTSHLALRSTAETAVRIHTIHVVYVWDRSRPHHNMYTDFSYYESSLRCSHRIRPCGDLWIAYRGLQPGKPSYR